MATEIRMPDLGTNLDTITVTAWLKQVGEPVKVGESLCEIETDKAVSELESVAAGVLLRHAVPEGTDVEVGDIIAYVGVAGEIVADGPTVADAANNETAQEPVKANVSAGRQTVSPLLRNLAERLGVDLDNVEGTGVGGRISREDVMRAAGK